MGAPVRQLLFCADGVTLFSENSGIGVQQSCMPRLHIRPKPLPPDVVLTPGGRDFGCYVRFP